MGLENSLLARARNMKINPLRKFPGTGQFAFISILAFLMMLGCAPRANAFSLIGPYTDWMDVFNGYRLTIDIGGPMNLDEEYRWDVPVITYDFDKSFIAYFGSNGVAAVESAIQILNDLPAASNIDLNNFPTDTRQVNFQAEALNVYDLKSTALALLVEQLGLGQPTRNILDVGGPQFPFPVCTNEVCPAVVPIGPFFIYRNFDPETLAVSTVVNGTTYNAMLTTNGVVTDMVEYPVDPLEPTYSAVADAFSYGYSGLQPGTFYSGLTSDDAGGLRYLLNATNINWESLPKDVLFLGKQKYANKRLRGAERPGVEKLTFVRQPQNKRGNFKTAVFKYMASYVTNGVVTEQPAKRVVSQPDILFSAAETFQSDPASPMYLRTGTENWVNNAGENGNAFGAGPGVITGPIKITFDELGPEILTGGPYAQAFVIHHGWSSFDQSTNPPITYPQDNGQTNLSVRLTYFLAASANNYTNFSNTRFDVPVPFGAPATLQISTNNAEWISLATVINNGSVVRWSYLGTPVPISFRVLPGAP
jgi:hypothetical protein